MGAWGTGPFDNDSALDWLSDLADQLGIAADYDAYLDRRITVTPLACAAAKAALAERLQLDDAGIEASECEEIYAAAGMVAAVRGGFLDVAVTGSRLGAALADALGDTAASAALAADPAGLANNPASTLLITQAAAAELAGPALTALCALRECRPWLDRWLDREEILDQLDRVSQTITRSTD